MTAKSPRKIKVGAKLPSLWWCLFFANSFVYGFFQKSLMLSLNQQLGVTKNKNSLAGFFVYTLTYTLLYLPSVIGYFVLRRKKREM